MRKLAMPKCFFTIWTVLYLIATIFGASVVLAYANTGGYKRSGTSVTYYINNGFTASSQTAIKAADATWDAAGSKFRFSYSSTTSRNPNVWAPSCDGYNDVGYATGGNNGQVALTVTTLSGTTMIETDTSLNFSYSFSSSGSSGYYDIQNTMTHEFGHWLYLNDLSSWVSPSWCIMSFASTMCGSSSTGETSKRSLETDDKNGIKAIYGF